MVARNGMRNLEANSSQRQTFVAENSAGSARVRAQNADLENLRIDATRKLLATNAFGSHLVVVRSPHSRHPMAWALPCEHALQFQTVSNRLEGGLRKGATGMSTANANARSSHLHDHVESADSTRQAGGDSVVSQLTLDPALGHYTEETFRFFLDIERKRAEVSGRPFLLLLLDLKQDSEPGAAFDHEPARLMSSALAACVRETDFVGWYRSGRVLGAVLTQHADAELANMTETVTDRIGSALRATLPLSLADRIQLRAYQLPPAPGRQS